MDAAQQKRLGFEGLVKECFGFAEEAQMCFNGVRISGGTDPRDAALVARYSGSDSRFDIGWNEFELSLSVLVKFDHCNLPRQECYVYFEPFIEYLTQGQEKAIVPYVTERMSVRSMESVMEQRKTLFAQGLEPVIRALGKKMKANFGVLMSVSQEQVQGYHKWMRSQH